MNKYEVHWLTGQVETMFGESISDALMKAGYGGAIILAIDYWKLIPED